MQFIRCSSLYVHEARDEYGCRNDTQECDRSNDSVAQDEGVVFWQVSKSIAHSIVSHGFEVQALEVGQEKGIAIRVPCSVANVHTAAVVRTGARRREAASRHGCSRGRMPTKQVLALAALSCDCGCAHRCIADMRSSTVSSAQCAGVSHAMSSGGVSGTLVGSPRLRC